MTTPTELLILKLSALSPLELEERRRQIVSGAKGDYESLSTESLQELAFITSTLRKRNAGPPKVTKVAKPKATLDSLLDI